MNLKRPLYLHDNMRNAFGERRNQKGEVGVEIEVEGRNLLPAPSAYWAPHNDGSLRGESIEYVFAVPLPRKDVMPALELLTREMDAHGSKVKESYRTSVHVHINQQGRTTLKVFNNIILYLILEDILVEYSGQDRVGNLFCLRAKDAEFLITQLRQALRTSAYNLLADTDHLRYSSCNVTALRKFNSLEFRSMRGTCQPDLINEWVNVLLDIKDASDRFDSPVDMLTMASSEGVDLFLRQTFNDLTCNLIMSSKNYEKRIKEGLRIVQDIVYSVDWTPGKPDQEEPQQQNRDGFARDLERQMEAVRAAARPRAGNVLRPAVARGELHWNIEAPGLNPAPVPRWAQIDNIIDDDGDDI